LRAGSILALIIGGVAAVGAGYWFLMRDGGNDVAAFHGRDAVGMHERGAETDKLAVAIVLRGILLI
jgi:hypothetical protein